MHTGHRARGFGPVGPIVVGLVTLSMLASSCTDSGAATGRAAAGTATSAPVRELESIAALRDSFNRDAGMVRLVLLISPT